MQVVRFKYVYLFIFLLSSIVLSSEKQVEVTNFFAKLYLAPSINSKFMGLAQKGERYPILLSSNYWFRIDFKGVPVWIENANIQLFDPDAPPVPAATENAPVQTTTTVPSNGTIDTPVTNPSPQTTIGEESVPEIQSTHFENRKVNNSNKVQDSIVQNSKFRRWISRESFSKLPIIEQNIEEERKDKFFLVTKSPSTVLLMLSPDSPIIGMVNRGERLQLIGEGDSWCKVAYKDTVGWIDRRDGRVVASTSFPIFQYFGTIIIIGAFILLIVLIFVIVKLFRRKSTAKPAALDFKKALIIAKEPKTVIGNITNTVTSMDKCFIEIGFEIKTTADLQNVKSTIETYAPDVVLIDWRFDRNLINSIERIFTSSPRANSIVVIIYNVPDPSSMFANPALPRMAFLGMSFSDRDLFKIVTPLMLSSEAEQMAQVNDQPSALEGEIAAGNLSEIMQYIEVGRKTGCLIIDTGKPFCLIYFKMGSIIYAATAEGLLAREALYAALNLKVGKFMFLLDKKPRASNTNLSTLEVLMSWTKELDETSKYGLRTS